MTPITNFTDAVRVAVEQGGYNTHGWMPKDESVTHDSVAITVIDPDFWRSLGKALGWEGEYYNYERWPSVGKEFLEQGFYRGWEYHWHRYIDALAEGKEDSFWKSLSKDT